MFTFKGGVRLREHGKKVFLLDKMSSFSMYIIGTEGLLSCALFLYALFILKYCSFSVYINMLISVIIKDKVNKFGRQLRKCLGHI